MARISTGPIIADISGKVGDNIFSRNANGPYVKAYAVPTIPTTTYTTAAKAAMSAAVAAWSALSELEVLAWSKFSFSYLKPTFHNGHRATEPRTLFISSYINQVYAGLSPAPLPVSPGVLPVTNFDLSIPDGLTFEGNFYGTAADSDYSVILHATFPLSHSVRSLNSKPLYFFGSLLFPGTLPVDLFDLYRTRFGGVIPQSGEKCFVTARFIHNDSGIEIGFLHNQAFGANTEFEEVLGSNTIYGTTLALFNQISYQVQAVHTGQVRKITVYRNAGGGSVRFGLYDDVADAPVNLLAQTALTSNTPATGWLEIDLITPVNVTAGQKLWLAAGHSAPTVYRRQDGTGLMKHSSAIGTTLQDPFVVASTFVREWSAYGSLFWS